MIFLPPTDLYPAHILAADADDLALIWGALVILKAASPERYAELVQDALPIERHVDGCESIPNALACTGHPYGQRIILKAFLDTRETAIAIEHEANGHWPFDPQLGRRVFRQHINEHAGRYWNDPIYMREVELDAAISRVLGIPPTPVRHALPMLVPVRTPSRGPSAGDVLAAVAFGGAIGAGLAMIFEASRPRRA